MPALQFSPKSTIIRQFLTPFQPWIEKHLGVSIDECLQLRLEQSIGHIATSHVLAGIKLVTPEAGWEQVFRNRLVRIELPPGHAPAISLKMLPDRERPFASREKCWHAEWLDCPAAIYLQGMDSPAVVVNVPFIIGANGEGAWREVVLIRRENAYAFLNLIQQANTAIRQPALQFYQGRLTSVRPAKWEDLVLDSSIVRLLQTDYQNFFQREAWFRENHLAFRRGYLLYGPPGNGKTSAIRAMLSHPGVTGHTINLFREHTDDDDLSRLFENATSTAPSIIVIEDLDRYFDQKRDCGPEVRVSLQHLLNCLDGAATQDGIIVVATANNPRTLDPAIVRRPGRFDRVVAFPNPAKDLRARYFQKLASALDSGSIEACAAASVNFSFAQLQESYIFAGQFAFDEQRPINKDDLLTAIQALRKSLQNADWKGETAPGFSAIPETHFR